MDFIAAHADLIIAVVQALFAVAMAPTVIRQWQARSSTVPLPSSLLTFGGLATFVAVYISLGLWYAAGIVAVTAVIWGLVAMQRFVYGQARDVPCWDCGRCGITFYSAICGNCRREERIGTAGQPRTGY